MKIGKYVVTGELGRGGMAVVYSALDPVIGRQVAVKQVRKADLGEAEARDVLGRFRQEAQAAGILGHPNIVGIYEYGEDDATAWIAMELVPGKSLREHLLAGYRPSFEDVPPLLAQVLEALDYAHGRGVVHRDVKPANVLVSEMGAAKIGDFGIARIEGTHAPRPGEIAGTPYYMAPELFEGSEGDERSDLYSAAVLAYEVLCGRRPFDGASGDLEAEVRGAPPAPPSEVEPRLPRAVDAVLLKALAKRPAERYAGVREFLDALRSAFREKTMTMNLGALRRGLQAATEPRRARRLPAVLFVDDEERILAALRALFEGTYEVETAPGAAAALELLRTRRFLVLVSDQRMPGMTGVELLREARSLAPATVRLLLTGYSDLAAIMGSVNDGEVFRFVSKPWEQAELKATLAEAVDVAIALEAAEARGRGAAPAEAAVLVLGDPELARAARELGGGRLRVLEARDSARALELLAAEDVGAVVCDLEAAGGEPAALLRVLKRQSPGTQLVAVSDAADADLVIGLINEARIHRFLRKPVNLSLLRQAIDSALERHARVKRTPGLARTEQARPARETAAIRGLLERVRALGGRFAKAIGSAVRPS